MAECSHVHYSRYNLRSKDAVLYWCGQCGSIAERQAGEDEPKSWNVPNFFAEHRYDDANPMIGWVDICCIKGCKEKVEPYYTFCRKHLVDTPGNHGRFLEHEPKKGMLGEPVPMLLWCPECGKRHIDVGEFSKQLHHTHACQHCGMVWRPAKVFTVGVEFLPGYKNEQL